MLPNHVKDGYVRHPLRPYGWEDVLFSKRPKKEASVAGASQA